MWEFAVRICEQSLSVFHLIHLLCCRCGRRAGYHAQQVQRKMHRKAGASRRGETSAPRRRRRALPSNQPPTGGGGTSSNRKTWKSHQASRSFFGSKIVSFQVVHNFLRSAADRPRRPCLVPPSPRPAIAEHQSTFSRRGSRVEEDGTALVCLAGCTERCTGSLTPTAVPENCKM